MGKDGRRFINKNDPSTFTFSLLSASHDDPNRRILDSSHQEDSDGDIHHRKPSAADLILRNALKREIPRNAARKGKYVDRLPDEILSVMDTKHFGLHENLPRAHIRLLCKEIYGVDDLPMDAFGTVLNKNSRIESGVMASRRATVEAPQHLHVRDTTNEGLTPEMLDSADCYFPADGYDYEKHLRPIQKDGGRFIPAKEAPADAVDAIHPSQAPTAEESEALDALERAEEYETLSDDFVLTAGGGTLLDENPIDILWGGVVLPGRGADGRRKDSAEAGRRRAELASLLQAGGGFQSMSESEYSDETNTSERRVSAMLHLRVTDRELTALLADEYNKDDGDIEHLGEEDYQLVDVADVGNFNDLLDEFIAHRKREQVRPEASESRSDAMADMMMIDSELDKQEEIRKILELANLLDAEDAERETLRDGATDDVHSGGFEEVDAPTEQWDCETILSSRSNLYNRPGRVNNPARSAAGSSGSINLIGSSFNAILRAKTIKRVMDTIDSQSLQEREESVPVPLKGVEEHGDDSDDGDQWLVVPEVITKRPKNETTEERKARKQAAKTARRMIRQCKQLNASVMKEEERKKLKTAKSRNPYDVPLGIRQFRV